MKKLSKINEGIIMKTIKRSYSGDTRKENYTGTNAHMLKPVDIGHFPFYVADDILRKEKGGRYFTEMEIDDILPKLDGWRLMTVREAMKWGDFWGFNKSRYEVVKEGNNSFVVIKFDTNEIKLPLCGYANSYIVEENNKTLCFWVKPEERDFFETNLMTYQWNEESKQDIYPMPFKKGECNVLLVKDK